MTIVLLAIGLLATAAGFVTIGFGIPINAFSLGNTLILAGTIAVATGLILIGLSVAIGQLRKIIEALLTAPRAAVRVAESAEVLATPRVVMSAPQASPAPLPDLEPLHAPTPEALRVPEPLVPSSITETPAPLDWLRARTKPATVALPTVEPPIVEVHDEAPLSPRPPQRTVVPPAVEPAAEPKLWSSIRETVPVPASPAPRAEQPLSRATPQVEAPREKDRFGFDLVWPDRAGGGGAPAPEPAKREPAPALDMPLPPVPARPRESRATEKRTEPPVPRKPLAERAPAILKSGVIDGMPYTLYADGSIEAQLPQGTVKFASVDALRAHLEKQS